MIEQTIETAALMLGTDKSRGYCLEMICADFLAGAHLDNGDPEILLTAIGNQLTSPGQVRSRVYYARNIKGGADTVTIQFSAN